MTTLMQMLAILAIATAPVSDKPFFRTELLFPLQKLHNHGSCVVELPGGDLLATWYRGSGERTADDVAIYGARLSRGANTWTEPFVMADTPGFPDTNPCMILDPRKRLWLLWPLILDNHWESALMRYRVSSHYRSPAAPPTWDQDGLLLVKPGPEFVQTMNREMPGQLDNILKALPSEEQPKLTAHIEDIKKLAKDAINLRLGWMTRAHPTILNGTRLLVPLSSDGLEFCVVEYTDDWGETWRTSAPIVGIANQQPSIVQRKDGVLEAFMRDDGPRSQPHVLVSESRDRGATWSSVHDTPIVDTGAGVEAIVLKSGRWLLVNNDVAPGRYRLAISISEDEGRTWPWVSYLERDGGERGAGSYCYPSIIQAADGTIHVTYSYNPNRETQKLLGKGESIKHAHFNEAWLLATRRPR